MPRIHVYMLRSRRDGHSYIGLTADLERRIDQHSRGENISTRHRRPLDLLYVESFIDRRDAERRERYFKTSKGKTTLRQMLRHTLERFDSS